MKQRAGASKCGALRSSGARTSSASLLLLAAQLVGCSEARETSAPAAEPGLPSAVAPLIVSVAPGYAVDCMGTLVHPHWAVSTAHCFSDTSPSAWVTLREFGAAVQVRKIIVYPGAVRLDQVSPGAYSNSDIVAAHDLALIPLQDAVDAGRVADLWRPSELEQEAFVSSGELSYGRHAGGEALTELGSVEGLVPASQLLGGEQAGELLSVWGRLPRGGDSGGGGFLVSAAREASSGQRPLVAIIQNAPASGDQGRFGLIPLFSDEHLAFIDTFAVEPEE